MDRLWGMMPCDEVEKEVHFKEELGTIIIQAGPNGWSIIYADGSSEYKDVQATTEVNYQTALDLLHTHFKPEDLEEIKIPRVIGEC